MRLDGRSPATRGRHAVSRCFRALLTAWGKEATEMLTGRRTLVVVAHPDDETLGCGSTLARLRRAGFPVSVVFATDGERSTTSSSVTPPELARIRRGEAVEACARLGIPAEDVITWSLDDGRLSRQVPDLVARLRRVIIERCPEQVFVTSSLDDHPDHQAVHRAVRTVLEDGGGWSAYEFLVWAWADGPWALRDGTPATLRATLSRARNWAVMPRPLLASTTELLDAKRAALAVYKSQTANLTGEDSWQYLPGWFVECFLSENEVFIPLVR